MRVKNPHFIEIDRTGPGSNDSCFEGPPEVYHSLCNFAQIININVSFDN